MQEEIEEIPSDEYYDEERNVIVGPADIDRQLAIVAYHERSLLEAEEVVRKRKADLDHWLAKKRSRIEHKIAWHTQGMQAYLSITKQKSIDLPNGRIYKRKQQPVFIWPEDKSDSYRMLCAKLAREAPDMVNQNININKSAIRKHFNETGEVVEGVEVLLDEPDKFHYQLSENLRVTD